MNKVTSKKKITIACDLFLNLNLYNLPQKYKQNFLKTFPNVNLVPVNIPPENFIDHNATIYWGNRIQKEIIKKMPQLEWIHFGSVGVNNARTRDVIDRKIIVTNSQNIVTNAMTSTVIAFMFSLGRGLHRSNFLKYNKKMNRENFDKYFFEINDFFEQKCLIVGYGNVGKNLAKVLKSFKMNISIITRSNLELDNFIDKSYLLEDLDNAVNNVDYIINLLPLTNKTQKVFTKNTFANMKKSSFFINIGRGETVDEQALIQTLINGKIAGAGLDVFENEPLSKVSPLLNMENVMLSPHVAGLSQSYWEKQYNLFTKNLKYYLDKKFSKMENIIDMETEL